MRMLPQENPAHLEQRIVRVCDTTTWLVAINAPKDRLRRAFEQLAELKAQRSKLEIYRLDREKGLR